MKRIHIVIACAVLLGAAAWIVYGRLSGDERQPYRLVAVERGNLESSVSATGTLSAVTTVQVGTQVSGRIVEIYADFNDRVEKGQLIARIDPLLLEQAVRDAEAGLERSRAEAAQAEREFERNRQLFERKVITEMEFNNAKYALDVARASLKSAQIALERAKQNLSYTYIYAPIDGVVVERNVDVGQTVAASLSTPQLFLIANDLSQMQILASVDESDIGAIYSGQPVRFSVQAYPNEVFECEVRQVRLQSTTTENVVTYTVVVSVANPTGKLLPGMTATVDFLTGVAEDVLIVPNAALRFRPTEEMLAAVRKRNAKEGAAAESAGGPGQGQLRKVALNGAGGAAAPGAGPAAGQGGRRRPDGTATLWYLDERGRPAMMRVRTGLTDGQRTEVSGPELREGMQIIVGLAQTDRPARPSSPFQPSGNVRMRF